MDKLAIPLEAIKEGVSTFQFRAVWPDADVRESFFLSDEVEVVATVTAMGDDYLIDLKVKGECRFLCDRCGVEFRRIVEGAERTLFTFDDLKGRAEESDDVRFLPPSSQEIDLTQDVLDALLLAVPSKCLCDEACLGLCSRCGANLNEERCSCPRDETEPRWEALKNIGFKD